VLVEIGRSKKPANAKRENVSTNTQKDNFPVDSFASKLTLTTTNKNMDKESDDRKAPQKFVKKSYDRSDDWAVSKVKEHLSNNGYTVIPKESEDYELDIKAVKNAVTEYYECETKTGYTFTSERDFRFSTLSFLARKKKWADIGFWYIIVCRETLAYAKCHSNVIFQDKYMEVLDINSQERKGKDTFYRVPKNLCEWGKLQIAS
jgi:hypothetical protein